MRKLIGLLAVLAVAFCACSSAQEFTSVAAIEKDGTYLNAFNIQGEYLWPEKNFGFQVVARGADKFDVVGYQDGLPGNGWTRDKARFFASAEIKGDKLVLAPQKMDIPRYGEDRDVVFNDEQKAVPMTAYVKDGKYFLNYKGEHEIQKVDRESETLGMKAPEGAIVLFDGQDRGWFAGDFKLSDEQEDAFWAEARFKPFERGRSYTLHLEFLLSFMPNASGQGRSNSGVYLQEQYECQVLDSFGLNGENNECGGFYQQLVPEVNMCFPPLTWQTYDFDVTPAQYENGKKVANAKIVVKHNGVQIHDAELANETPGGKNENDEATETTGRGIYLQGHGNKVQYRNIWIKYND
ncbi:MAG: DUF1080 domain-containing protein [Thermoguttaceae bacterium]|jgi:hypothetical protein|nr:DUF1080 domain-containing protein [Thermoguttaceae bacterium]